MAEIAMSLKCPVGAAEDRADSEYESARSDNKADGAFQAHPAGRCDRYRPGQKTPPPHFFALVRPPDPTQANQSSANPVPAKSPTAS